MARLISCQSRAAGVHRRCVRVNGALSGGSFFRPSKMYGVNVQSSAGGLPRIPLRFATVGNQHVNSFRPADKVRSLHKTEKFVR